MNSYRVTLDVSRLPGYLGHLAHYNVACQGGVNRAIECALSPLYPSELPLVSVIGVTPITILAEPLSFT